MAKPVVTIKNVTRLSRQLVGTIVHGHPWHEPGTEVVTSDIVKEHEDGTLETRNTIYKVEDYISAQ